MNLLYNCIDKHIFILLFFLLNNMYLLRMYLLNKRILLELDKIIYDNIFLKCMM